LTTPRILFSADSGPTIGGGHVMRCLTLARSLMGQGAACAFAAPPDAMRLLETFAPVEIERLPIPDGTPARQAAPVADLARTWGAQAAVLDHYGAGPAEEVMIRTGVHRLLVLDDLKRGHLCDLVLDSNLDRAASDYPGVESLIGPAYALVRPEFAALRTETLARRATATPHRLLIALGLTDVGGVTARVVEAILPSLGDHQVDVVLGQGAPSLSTLAPLAAHDPRLILHVDTREMAALTAAADLAIGAGGSSVWERCCLGLATLTLILADNQREAALALAARGAAEALEAGEGDVAVRLAALLADPLRLAAMSAAASALCDGQGAARVAGRLLAIL
jgi:UDP-2,4-diacetamido-2,4,6-trideoxy-beta-L-altropyranose hydrolase